MILHVNDGIFQGMCKGEILIYDTINNDVIDPSEYMDALLAIKED